MPSNLPYHRYICIIWFLPKWINIHSLKLTVCPWTLAIPKWKTNHHDIGKFPIFNRKIWIFMHDGKFPASHLRGFREKLMTIPEQKNMAPPISQGGYLIFVSVQNGYFMIPVFFLWHLHCFHLFLTLQHHGANTFGPDSNDSMLFFPWNLWIMGPLFRGFVGDYTAQLQGDYNKPWSLGNTFLLSSYKLHLWFGEVLFWGTLGGGKGGGAEHEQRLIVCTFCLKLPLRHPLIYLCDAWAKPIWNKICSGKLDDLCQHKEQKIQQPWLSIQNGNTFSLFDKHRWWQDIYPPTKFV